MNVNDSHHTDFWCPKGKIRITAKAAICSSAPGNNSKKVCLNRHGNKINFFDHAGSKLRHCYQRQYNSCEIQNPVASGHPFDPGKSETSRWDAIIVKCDCFVRRHGRIASQMAYRDARPAPCHLGISGGTACSAEDPSALRMTRRLGTWDKEPLTTTLSVVNSQKKHVRVRQTRSKLGISWKTVLLKPLRTLVNHPDY